MAAHEIMIGIPGIRNLIREDKVAQMYSAIQTGSSLGMKTLDQCLEDLVTKNERLPGTRPGEGQDAGGLLIGAPPRKRPATLRRLRGSMEFDKLLKLVVEKGHLTCFITAGKPPILKINGKLTPRAKPACRRSSLGHGALGIMNKDQQIRGL